MITVHLKKLKRRVEISSEEERVIRDAVAEVRQVSADQMVISAGEELTSSLLLLDGWMSRVKDLAGGERQVTELHDRRRFRRSPRFHTEAPRPRPDRADRLPAGGDTARADPRDHRGTSAAGADLLAVDEHRRGDPARARIVARTALGDLAHGASVLRALRAARRRRTDKRRWLRIPADAARTIRMPRTDRGSRQPDSAGASPARA